ncbi:lipopolysaccharide biosynthesis protein [Candidatus Omnitrophota bacterium]
MKFYIKKILRHSTFYAISNLFIGLTAFILIPLYTQKLRPQEYGAYSIIALFGTILLYVCDLGMINALVKHYFEFGEDDLANRQRLSSTALWFFVSVPCVFLGIFLLTAGKISALILGGSQYARFLQLMLAIIFFKHVSAVPMTVLRMKEKSILFMCLYALENLGIVVLAYLFLSVFNRGLLGVFESILLPAAIVAVLSFVFTRRNYSFKFSFEYAAKMLKYGIPLWLPVFCLWIIDFSDRYLIRYFLSLSDVGVYSLGYKFGLLAHMAVVSFLMCWGPLIFASAKEQHHRRTLARLSTYVAAAFMFICLIISFFGREIVILLAESAYHSAYKVIPLISFSYYLYGIYMLFLSGILLSKPVFKQTVILGAAAVINILLNSVLIPVQGIMGAAIATIITYLFVVGYTYPLAQRSYRIPYELKRLTLMTLSGIAIFAVSLLVPRHSLIQAAVIKFFMLWLFPLSLFALGIFNKAQLLKGKEILVRAVSRIS